MFIFVYQKQQNNMKELEKYVMLNKDVITLLDWELNFAHLEGRMSNYTDKYSTLLMLPETATVDVSLFIDEIILNCHIYYEKMKDIASGKEDLNIPMLTPELKNDVIKQYRNSIKLFDKILSNYKFESTDVKKIQKNHLKNVLDYYIKTEKFEKCDVVHKKLKSIEI